MPKFLLCFGLSSDGSALFLTLVDLFLLLLRPVPLHCLIYFTFKTSGLSDAEAARLFLFKLLLLPLVPVLVASPNGPDESG